MKKNLKINLITLFSFSILDRVVSGFLSVIIFTILIRNISHYEVGLWGLFTGIFVFFNFLNISPVTIIFRDFKKIKDIGKEFGNFIIFNFYKTVFFLIIALIIAIIYNLSGYNKNIYLIILYVLFFSLMNMANIATEGLYVSFNQGYMFLINMIFYLIQLIFYFYAMPHFKSLFFYLVTQIGFVSIYLLITFNFFLKKVNTKLKFSMDWKKFLKDNLFEFSLWNHFNGAITFLIYKIDTFILSFFTSMENLAIYTVALTFSNYFFIIPQKGEKTLKVGFSRVENKEMEKKLALYGTIILDIISLLQLLFFFLVGKVLIRWMFPTVNVQKVYELTALILIGITILNLSRPTIAHLFVHTSMKRLFLRVFLPAGIIAIIVYFFMALLYGIVGVAFGNIIAYTIFGLLIILYKKGKDIEGKI